MTSPTSRATTILLGALATAVILTASAGSQAQAALIRETAVEFLQGEMCCRPPVFTPSLGERYRLVR